jgi:hypothetical protein
MEEQQTDTTQMDATSTAEPQLTLADIALMASVIAVVSRRGGFEAGELKAIGELYEKIIAFLPKQEEVAAQTANTSEEVPENQLSFDFVEGKADDTATQ